MTATPTEHAANAPAQQGRVRRWWAAWLRLLDHKETGEVLAFLRIAASLIVFTQLIVMIHRGLVDVYWIDAAYGGMKKITRPPWLIAWLGGAKPTVVWGVVWFTVVTSLLNAVGFGGRVTAFLCLQGYIACYRLNLDAHGAYDTVITNALWIVVLGASTTTWSVDCKRKTGRWWSDEKISAWPRYLIVLQIVLLYGTTGIQKVSAYWTPIKGYSALYYILQQPSWHNSDMRWVASFYPLTQVATFIAWWWEVLSFGLIAVLYFRATSDRPGRLRRWVNRYDLRLLWVAIGVCMHTTIIATMSVGPFSYISMSLYPALFQPDEYRRAWAWLLRKRQVMAPGGRLR